VQDALAGAGGLTPNAWTRGVTLTRGGKPVRLDLQALYDEGDLSQNWLLQDGDVLHVPSREENKVFVLGEVRTPSSKLMAKGRMSLAEALGEAAGLDPTSSNGDVYVFRGRYEQPRVYRLGASSADAMLLAVQFQLEPHDVVYVTTYGLTAWNRIVTQIFPTVQGLWQTVDLANRGADIVKTSK
jgi:polysaccharide export outer membrane protein